MTGSVTTIRCSSLDKLFACTPSIMAGPEHVRISPTNDAAELGKTVHELAESWVANGDYDLGPRCDMMGLSETQRGDVVKLMGYVTRSWEELKPYFPNPVVEQPIKSDVIDGEDGKQYQIVGTTDINSAIGTDNAIFLDWKSGFLDDGYHQQMFGYAYSIWCALGRPPNTLITGVVVFLRHRYYRVAKYTATQLSQWEYDLVHNVLPASDKFRPGKQCRFCDLYASCPARRAVVANMLDTLMPKASGTGKTEYDQFLEDAKGLLAGLHKGNKDAPEVGQTIEKLSFRIRMAQQQIDDAKALIRGSVARVGDIKLTGDYVLTLREVEVNKVKAVKALKLLRTKMSDTEICQAMKLSMPTLMGLYAKRFPQGQRSAAREQLFNELKDADAISVDVQHRLEEVDMSKIEMTKKESKDGNKSRGNTASGGGTDQGEGLRTGAGSSVGADG